MRTLIFLLCCSCWPSFAMAGYDETLEKYNKGDLKTAVKEFQELANQGNARAQSMLGYMYEMGIGVAVDYKQAVAWNLKAAEQGDEIAQLNLGYRYRLGHGVSQDYAQSADWYSRAANRGNAFAQFTLATMYNLGQGVPKDQTLAYMWYNLAAASGFDDAAKARDALETNMAASQLVEAQRLAREWVAKHPEPKHK